MRMALSLPTSGHASPHVRAAAVQSAALAIACLIAYELITQLLGHIYFLSHANSLLGGMWAVIATIFVFRLCYEESIVAAVSRMTATLVSFVLCLVYLVFLPFSVWGMAMLIGVGALVITLLGRPRDVVTTGITTAVVMVVAALNPHNAWEQPILRLVDTMAGVAVGVAAAWVTQRATELRRRALTS